MSQFDAVLFDMGGVILTGPFAGFARYEREAGLPPDTIRRINSTNPDTNAWAYYERGAIDRAEFVRRFQAEADALGFVVDAEAVLASMGGAPVPEMMTLIPRLASRFRLGMITNNLHPIDWPTSAIASVIPHFSAIVESSVVGVRKPDPAIYALACEQLGVSEQRCIFLDDLGINLKPARAMGMTTIKVVDPAEAAAELAALTAVQ